MTTLSFNYVIDPLTWFVALVFIAALSATVFLALHVIGNIAQSVSESRSKERRIRQTVREAREILRSHKPTSGDVWTSEEWAMALRQVGTINSIDQAKLLEARFDIRSR